MCISSAFIFIYIIDKVYMEEKMKNGYKLLYCLIIVLIFIIINILIRNYFTPIFFIIILYIIASPMYKHFKVYIKSNRLASLMTVLLINILLIF